MNCAVLTSLFSFIFRAAMLGSPLLLTACLVTPPAAEKAKNQAPLKVSVPKMRSDQKQEREKWTVLSSTEGQAFAQAKDGMDDVVAMSATESKPGIALATLDEAEATLRASTSARFLKLRRAEILGQPCIRYEQKVEAPAQENEALRLALNAHGRTATETFYARTLGAVFLHPTKPGRAVTLLCTRTSYHGEIGDYYEELFDDFLSAFVAENCIAAAPYGNL